MRAAGELRARHPGARQSILLSTRIVALSMTLHPEVVRIAEDIKRMRIRGAGRIARAAATALKIAARSSKAEKPSDFRAEIDEASRVLLSTRPTAVSLPNAIRFVSLPVEVMGKASVEELRRAVVSRADEFVKSSLRAVQRIGEIGATMVRSGEKLLTHCNSECALSVIKRAHSGGKQVHVFVTESRPRRQGLITFRELLSCGIPCTLIVDSAVRYFMREIDRVIVGADAILMNGAVVNKIGTSQIALAAHEAGVPFMVAAETYKLHPGAFGEDDVVIEERDSSEVVDPDRFPGGNIRNPAFDVTPPRYIKAIITERGVIPPSGARGLARDVFSWKIARKKVERTTVEDSEGA